MELTLLIAAIQSSILLGLLHGVNPCGHSWLVLVPFISGEKRGRRVFYLTASFVAGTALACLVLGATLGALSSSIPLSFGFWLERITSIVLIVLGLILLCKPTILHHHDHDHESSDHHHSEPHNHSHHHGSEVMGRFKGLRTEHKFLPFSLFIIGFVNMIVPCPTAAVMYGYALNSGSAWAATLVFAAYAVATAIAVSVVIFLIFRMSNAANKLQKQWVEPLIMRLSGLVIVIFSGYGLVNPPM